MSFTVKPGKYLIEKTRRNTVGVIALVGTGGSVPGPVQQAINAYAASLARSGSSVHHERETIRAGMKQMQGTWLVLSPAGIRWAYEATRVPVALRNSGWSPPKDQLAALFEKNG